MVTGKKKSYIVSEALDYLDNQEMKMQSMECECFEWYSVIRMCSFGN